MFKIKPTFASFSFLALYHFISLCLGSSLYSPYDRLWELGPLNFERLVHEQTTAWAVEFYSEYCTYCIRFAPEWKEFASDIENWRNVIQVGVINCVDSDNTKLCRQYNVSRYPTIKFFPPHFNGSEQGVVFEGDRDLSRVRSQTIDFLQSHQSDSLHWPVLEDVKSYSIWDFFDKMPSDVDSAYIYVEHPESYVGREIILDFSLKKNLVIRRMLPTNTALLHEIVSDFKNGTKGKFVKIFRNNRKEVLNVFDGDMDGVVIRDLVYETLVGEPRVTTGGDTSVTEDPEHKILKGVYMADLENAVAFLLRQEVSVHTTISGSELAALKAFISALRLYFPGRAPVTNYLTKLNQWMQTRKGNVTGERFATALEHILSETADLPAVKDWVGCRGSQAKYRGYNCGLWTLFHTLTVQAYTKYDLHDRDDDLNPLEVLFAIRGYVTYFFSCEGCSRHFQEMSANLENEAKSPKDTILWLWQAHNQVNKRLAGDETEDPRHPKIQFPSEESCDKCRFKTAGKDIEWDEKAVLRYVQYFYKKENIKPIDERHYRMENQQTASGLRFSCNSFLMALLPMYRFVRPF